MFLFEFQNQRQCQYCQLWGRSLKDVSQKIGFPATARALKWTDLVWLRLWAQIWGPFSNWTENWISGNCSCSQVNWEFLLWGLGFKKFTGNFTTYLRGEICTENFVLWYMYPHQNWQHSDKFLSLVLPSYWTGIWFQSVSWLSRCLIRLILSWVECAHIGFSLALMFSGQLSRGDSWSEEFFHFVQKILSFLFLFFPSVQ